MTTASPYYFGRVGDKKAPVIPLFPFKGLPNRSGWGLFYFFIIGRYLLIEKEKGVEKI